MEWVWRQLCRPDRGGACLGSRTEYPAYIAPQCPPLVPLPGLAAAAAPERAQRKKGASSTDRHYRCDNRCFRSDGFSPAEDFSLFTLHDEGAVQECRAWCRPGWTTGGLLELVVGHLTSLVLCIRASARHDTLTRPAFSGQACGASRVLCL